MELSNVVFSSTLIFLLILCALLIVGFLLLQSRKDHLSLSERKTKTRSTSSLSHALPVSAEKYSQGKYHSTAAQREKYNKFKNDDEDSAQRNKISTNTRPAKPVSRGRLVREHYNSGSFDSSTKEKNNDIIRFN